MGWFDFLKLDPTITDPAIALAAGITTDNKGVIHLERTAASDRLASNLAQIAPTALMPAVEYVSLTGRALPSVVNTGRALPSVVNTGRALPSVVNTGSNLAGGVAGTVALGTAVGQGMSEPAQKKVLLGSPKNSSKLPYNKYNQRSYQSLVRLQRIYGGHLIRQKDGSYFLRNQYGSFYGNGRALNAKTGKMLNYDLLGSGHFINDASKLAGSAGEKSLPGANTNTNLPRINNSAEGKRIMAWLRKLGVKADGYWGKNTAAAYNKYLANLNTNKPSLLQTTLTIHQQTALTPIQGTPGYSMHVGNNGVTLSTPNLGTIPTNLLENTPLSSYQKLSENNFNRADIRLGMRDMGLNPYSYSGSDRRLLRTYLNSPTSDNYTESVSKIVGDSRVLQRMLNNAVLTDKYQLAKPLLVDLKFKKGGMLVNKYQQGGATSDPMDLLAQVAAKFLQGDTQSGQQLAQVFSDQKVGKQLMQAVQQGVQLKDKRAIIIAQAIQALSGSRKARLGAKLNYFRKSMGECPEGEKLVYFKKGGSICKKCQKMEEGGTADPIADFKKKKAALKKPILKQDLATRDSIAANRYNDQEVQVFRPGSYKKNAKGQVQWTPDRTKAPYNKVTKHLQGGSFKEAFDSAYGKQRYFTWNGKVYAAYKGDKRTDKGFQKAVDNIQELANALKDYGAGQHLGWDPGANTTAIKHNSSGNMQGVLNDVVVTAKRISPKLKANNLRKQYFDQWTAYVKKWHPNMLGRFKNTMQNMGYNYNWNTGTYDKNGKPVYRLNNGQLQTANIYTGNWSNISNSDALPGMPANGLSVRLLK